MDSDGLVCLAFEPNQFAQACDEGGMASREKLRRCSINMDLSYRFKERTESDTSLRYPPSQRTHFVPATATCNDEICLQLAHRDRVARVNNPSSSHNFRFHSPSFLHITNYLYSHFNSCFKSAFLHSFDLYSLLQHQHTPDQHRSQISYEDAVDLRG